MADAIAASAPLVRLGDRLRESDAMLATVRPLLPPGLAAQVRAGPLDDTAWALLAGNAGVAAKLRQLAPRLEAALHDAGHAVRTVRVRVLPA